MHCLIIVSNKKVNLPDLELLRVPVDDLPLEGVDEGVRVEEDWTVGEEDVSLLDWLEVLLGGGGLADGASAKVHDLVTVLVNLAVEVRHPGVGPVLAWHRDSIYMTI